MKDLHSTWVSMRAKARLKTEPSALRAAHSTPWRRLCSATNRMRAQEEGIIMKGLQSTWNNKRTKAWLKFKPDYAIRLDMDAVVIGVCFGKNRRGAGADGKLYSEYIMALRIKDSEFSDHKFLSFCRRAHWLPVNTN